MWSYLYLTWPYFENENQKSYLSLQVVTLCNDEKFLVLSCAVFRASITAITTANTFTCLLWDESEFGETLPEHCKVSILGSDKLMLHNRIFNP